MSRREFPEKFNAPSSQTNLIVDATATKVVSPTTPTVGAIRNIYASTAAPTSGDGADGDIWFKYA
jgi:hypothetical protein